MDILFNQFQFTGKAGLRGAAGRRHALYQRDWHRKDEGADPGDPAGEMSPILSALTAPAVLQRKLR